MSYLGAPKQGQRKPLFYECLSRRDPRGKASEAGTFLVKALSHHAPMVREIVGNRIAGLAGLRTPEPALVFLVPELARRADEARKAAGVFSAQKAGWTSGARQFNATNVMALRDVPAHYRDDALRLYVFDMLALHTDRVERNPNCAITRQGLMVFDFEQCFMEPNSVPEDCPHWAVATAGLGGRHMFYTGLRGAERVRQTARRVVEAMTESRLEACLMGLPNRWVPEGKRIVAHVRNVRNHADEFVDDIVRSLA